MKPFIRKTIRRSLALLALLLVSILLALLTSQYWLPWVAPSTLRVVGVEIESVHRSNEGRIVIKKLSYPTETVRLVSEKIVLPNLYQYFSALLIRREWSALSGVEIETLDVYIPQIASAEKDSEETFTVFPVDMIRSVRNFHSSFYRLIPPVSIESASVSNDDLELQLKAFEITDTQFSVIIKSDLLPEPIVLRTILDPESNWTLHAATDKSALIFEASMEEETDGYLFSGQIRQPGEIVELTVELKSGELLPRIFGMHSSGFTLDASLLCSLWPDWNGGSLELQTVQLDWNAGVYDGTFKVIGELPEIHGWSTPIEASFEVEGDLTATTVQSLSLHSPLAEASLSHPIILRFGDAIEILSPFENAELTALIDLSQQSWIDAEGKLTARFRIPVDRRFADSVLYFEVAGDALAYAGRHIESFQATGFLKDPVMVLESASIQPDSDNDTVIVFNGGIDLSTQALDLDYEIKLANEFLHGFLEMPVFSDRFWVKGNAEGPWISPELNFEILDATLDVPELKIINLYGAGSIKNLNSFEWNGLVESEGAFLNAEIIGKISVESIHLEILSLALYDPQLPEFTLSEPFSIDFDLTKDRVSDRLSVSAFELSGVEQKLSATYNPEAGLSLKIGHFSSVQLNRWLCKPLPSYELESLTARIAAFDPSLEGELEINLLELDFKNSFLDRDLPMIDSIQLQASANPECLEIESVRVLSNQSELEGFMMFPADRFNDWLYSDVREATNLLEILTAELNLKNWKMENWVEWMPAGLFRRSGSLNGSIKISEGFDLSGFIEFEDFALRPTGSLSPVDQISGQLLLADKRLELQSTFARIGGSDFEAAGWVNFQDSKDIFWDIKISGENIPILRTTDMILRSDVSLEALHLERGSKPVVQGRFDLRASTLLIEFDPLSASTESEPGLRPPFFSIDQELINEWLFDITIFGESFMRVRSPYFKTQLSADFHLGGSFEKPELIGSVRTVDGQLSFPGMKMQINEGEAFIVPSEPNIIYLDFTGTAQSTSHVVTMEVSNTIDEPYIQFHSTPELPNTAIVRLLATGTTNETGAAAIGLYLGKGFLGAGSMNETLLDRLTVDVSKKQSRSGRQTFSARFELNEDWSLNGEYDQYDAYNMDLIWHLLKR